MTQSQNKPSVVSVDKVPTPQLIVQLVVDQLRGDLLAQYRHQLGTQGFNLLYRHGLDYRQAYHGHAYTVTCAGHASIATGAYPSLHGIVGNSWYDKETQRFINCVEEPTQHTGHQGSPKFPTNPPLVTDDGTFQSREKTDTAPVPSNLATPIHLLASTISDEIVLAHKGKAFSVSFKDRGAIMLGGHAGKAFWFDKINGGFITSPYYYSRYPDWVHTWNRSYIPKDQNWELHAPLDTYLHRNTPCFEHRFDAFKGTFPHPLGSPKDTYYYKFLSMTPWADRLTADFALHLLKAEKLGKTPDQTDYLAISFSATDAIGHQFGPNSLESEENLFQLDKTLTDFIKSLDQEVGLDKVLIVLTADHGVSDSPVYISSHHMQTYPNTFVKQLKKRIQRVLKDRFDLAEQTLQAISLPYIYLDHARIHQKKLSVKKVADYLTDVLQGEPGVFQFYALPFTSAQPQGLRSLVDHMAFPSRSGDLYVVPLPYTSSTSSQKKRVIHGTPWQYDRYVPLIFFHPKFKAQHILNPVEVTAIAPTLAAILSLKAPSAAVDPPLSEVTGLYFSN
ncbi:MAG: alkaline phosphatase family protein [Legionella sp.]|nr:alkaline phosphatase family protein [Legionella sp.]